jgi:hypothetical protein
MENNHYCPMSYTTEDGSNYSTVPLTLDEGVNSGLAFVQLTHDYAGYGDGGNKSHPNYVNELAHPGTYPNVQFKTGNNPDSYTSPQFQFGQYVHGMADSTNPVLKSSKSLVFEKTAEKPRMVDCFAHYNTDGLRDINLNMTTNKCTAHFSCDKYLGSNSDVYNDFNSAEHDYMIPMDPNPSSSWNGGYCNGGGVGKSGTIFELGEMNPISNFTRCQVDTDDSGVY